MIGILRDKTRDKLAQHLNFLGVRADLAERGRVEEKIENLWYQYSLGIIYIQEGLIKWINIVKKPRSKNSPPHWRVILGIPDERLFQRHQEIKIKTVRKKTFPLFGKVVDVRWEGEDYGLGLINFLSGDMSVKNMIVDLGNLEVRSHADKFRGWTLKVDRRIKATNLHWEVFQKIAKYILSSTLHT
ncbi:hypothetical protein ACFLWV_02940 [Chloroflexota bacterium]